MARSVYGRMLRHRICGSGCLYPSCLCSHPYNSSHLVDVVAVGNGPLLIVLDAVGPATATSRGEKGGQAGGGRGGGGACRRETGTGWQRKLVCFLWG